MLHPIARSLGIGWLLLSCCGNPLQAAKPDFAKIAKEHWAFQPIRPQMLPAVKQANWAQTGLDRFVLARLEKEGLAPSPNASRATLLRRLSLDLLGLPPTPAEVSEFVTDTNPDAYERAVDRLLASPHYGERWGRHWLDLARYADSDGYEKDTGRPFAWRYRNWVIEAFNRDLPYDRMIVEQLAGDLLPNATLEQKVATGFHRNTLTNREGGVDKEQFRVEQVVDRVNTTAKVFLGLTLGCAQCHDHKYDPLTQKEYYEFFAFFNSDVEVDLPAPSPNDGERFGKDKAGFDKKHAALQKAVADYTNQELAGAYTRWEAGLKAEERTALAANVQTLLQIAPEKRTEKQKQALLDVYSKLDKKLAELTKAVTDHAKQQPQPTKAQTLSLGPTRKTHLLVRGDFLRPGEAVQHNVPTALPALPKTSTGRSRLELARWLVSPEHPLTSRVAVNWVWQKFFGRGLVSTLDDFGTQGELPTHPELLDYLAHSFRTQGWSLKALHREIVLSATYKQSSQFRPDLYAKDPYNTLLAKQSRLRLEAEVLRDNALSACGLLSHTVGGPSVRPPQPAGISELTYAGSAKWVESTGADRYRRGLYTWFQRTSPYPMLMTFDAPDANVCVVRRDRSNTPLQALILLNDVVFVECDQALAKRLLTELPKGTTEERVRLGVQLCLGREPTIREQSILLKLYTEMLAECQAKPQQAAQLLGKTAVVGMQASELAAWTAWARTLMNVDEFVMRE